jgi:toxin ParE1/3/4
LAAAAEYFQARGSRLGKDLVHEARHIANEILEYPHSGAEHRFGTRRRVIGRFPYSIVYRIKGSEILILAFPHHRQREGYRAGRR